MGDLWQLSACELADAIRSRAVSSREAVEAHLARIGAINRRVNAITVILADEALAAADEADRELARRGAVGALHGVPITVKENIDVAGTATTWGVRAFAEAVASTDAPHVGHLRAAGAIPIGRTNLPDFALRWHTDSGVRGATTNPWDPMHTPGGSSGGEAVALATGMTPLGIGNDLGGSLRWPSQCCGISAVRPTLGRVPDASANAPVNWPIGMQLMNVQGPMARRVRDLRVALEIMSWPHPRDPWYVPAPLAGPPRKSPMRVAVVRDPAGLGVDPGVAAGVDNAADALAAAGYSVEELEPPSIGQAAELWAQFIAVDTRATRPLMEAVMSDGARTFLALSAAVLPDLDMPAYGVAFMARQGLLRAWLEFLDRCPLILAPICTSPPFRVGADLTPDGAAAIFRSMRMVVAVNLLGLPSVAAPVGVSGGLPQAVQIIGSRYREDLCLDAAEALERRFGTITPIDPRG